MRIPLFAVLLVACAAALRADSMLDKPPLDTPAVSPAKPYTPIRRARKTYDFQLHDTIVIDIAIRDTLEFSRKLDTKRDLSFGAKIKKFVTYFGLGKTQTPEVGLEAQSQLKSDGKNTSQSNVKINVPADVVEILPNGDLVIDASRTVTLAEDTGTVRMGGVVPPAYVQQRGDIFFVASDRIKDMTVVTETKGPLSDNQKRGLIIQFLEKFRLF